MRDEDWLARVRFRHGGGGHCQCPVCDVPDLIDEIDRLRAECFKLSAGVCEYRGGNEHGNPLCLKTNQLI